jgi:hypothetical protein
MNKIAPAFVAAKKAFGPALKDRSNPAFKSKYADLGACIDAVEDALLANGIAAYHESSEDPAGITIECVLLHESGDTIRGGKLHVPATKHDAQGFGSAMTYARRYSLMAVCGIAPEDDDGNGASKAKADAEKKLAAEQRAQWLEAQAMKLEACESLAELQDAWKAAFAVMKKQQDSEAIATLEPIKDRMKALIAEATA